MENQPKKLITRILEFAALFALSAYLMKLGVVYLCQIRVALIVIAVISGVVLVGYRIYKNHVSW